MTPVVANGFLEKLASLLGPLSPFTKAIVPAALSLVVAVVDGLLAGAVNTSSVAIAGTGLVLALVAFLLPNRAHVTPPVVPPVPVKPAKSAK